MQAVASFYPLFEVTEAVGGDRVGVDNLTPVGVEPHDIELSPRQIDTIADADLLVHLGGGFQPAIEEAARRAGLAVDVSQGLPMEGGDPHVWLDPVLFQQVVGTVEAALMQVDPAGADGYRARAAEYRSRLEQLDADYRAGLADCDRRVIVTGHEAFGYLARRYNLEQVAIAGLSPDAEPDPRRLAELTDLVRQRGVTTIFTEELVSPKVAETLAREAGVDDRGPAHHRGSRVGGRVRRRLLLPDAATTWRRCARPSAAADARPLRRDQVPAGSP